MLGNEVSGDRQWQGVIRLVAIHNRVLTPAQIQQNFDVGVGQKFFLLFSVADLINLPDSYIMFEGSQFDSYSYLFIEPTFINLDPNVLPGNIPLMGMRIGINGAEADVGQAYANLDTAISNSQYSPASGQLLSRLGTVIGLEKGPSQDEFFLTFEILGSNQNVKTPSVPLQPGPPPPLPARPDIGVRTFEEVHTTLSEVTSQHDSVRRATHVRNSQATNADVRRHRRISLGSPGRCGAARYRVLQCTGRRHESTSPILPGVQFCARPERRL